MSLLGNWHTYDIEKETGVKLSTGVNLKNIYFEVFQFVSISKIGKIIEQSLQKFFEISV